MEGARAGRHPNPRYLQRRRKSRLRRHQRKNPHRPQALHPEKHQPPPAHHARHPRNLGPQAAATGSRLLFPRNPKPQSGLNQRGRSPAHGIGSTSGGGGNQKRRQSIGTVCGTGQRNRALSANWGSYDVAHVPAADHLFFSIALHPPSPADAASPPQPQPRPAPFPRCANESLRPAGAPASTRSAGAAE